MKNLIKLKLFCNDECDWYKGIIAEKLAHNNYSILIPHYFGKNRHGFLPSCVWIGDCIGENDKTNKKYPFFHTDDIPYKLTKNLLKFLLSMK